MSNPLTSDPCRKQIVAVHQSNLGECSNTTSSQDIFNTCNSLEIQTAYFWLKLILGYYYNRHRVCAVADVSSSFTVKLYTNGSREGLFQDLANGKCDMYPFQIVVTQVFINDFYIVTPLMISKYNFYVNAKVTDFYSHSAPWTFLTSPFTGSVWACTLLALALGFVLMSLVHYSHNDHDRESPWRELWSKRLVSGLIFFPLAALGAPYCSLLKARVLQHNELQPFSSLDGLATIIQSGKSRILMENNIYTRRWRMLTDPSYNRAPPLHRLHEALKTRNGSVHLAENMTTVCRLLDEHPDQFIYFGYHDLVQSSCYGMCFWKYNVKEDVDPVTSFVMGKHVMSLSLLADVMSHAVPNFEHMESHRRHQTDCHKRMTTVPIYIDASTLFMAFHFLAIGYGCAILLLITEMAMKRMPSFMAQRVGRAKKGRISLEE